MKFPGYVYTVIPKEDLPHLLKWGLKLPEGYEATDLALQGSVKDVKDGIVITVNAPDVPESTREYVEAVRCDNGYKVRRWTGDN